MMEILEESLLEARVSDVKTRIAAASEAWQHDVRVIAVTKTVEAERINLLTNCGITDIAENRVQELMSKRNMLDNKLFLHFIGLFQKNKVKYIVNKDLNVGMVQSLDRKSLAKELDRYAGEAEIRLPVLIQLNIIPEPQKGGVTEEDLPDLLRYCASLTNLHVQGLMWIAPATQDAVILRSYFRKVRQLFDRLRSDAQYGVDMDWLSMGMSSDYELAVSEGSNMVRLGSVLFGARVR